VAVGRPAGAFPGRHLPPLTSLATTAGPLVGPARHACNYQFPIPTNGWAGRPPQVGTHTTACTARVRTMARQYATLYISVVYTEAVASTPPRFNSQGDAIQPYDLELVIEFSNVTQGEVVTVE
jgi:hypothetical protein